MRLHVSPKLQMFYQTNLTTFKNVSYKIKFLHKRKIIPLDCYNYTKQKIYEPHTVQDIVFIQIISDWTIAFPLSSTVALYILCNQGRADLGLCAYKCQDCVEENWP